MQMKNLMIRHSQSQKTFFFLKKAIALLLALFSTVSLLTSLPAKAEAAVPVGGEWSRNLSGQSFATPAAANRLVYVGSNEGVLYAFDGISGKTQWEFKTDYGVPCLPLVGRDGMIYLCSDNGAIHVLSAFTGKLAWKNTEDTLGEYTPSPKLPYYHVFAPALSPKQVFLTTPNGNLHAFDRSTGATLWVYYNKGGYITSPSVHNDMVFIGSEDGKLIAIDIESGKENWSFQTKDAIHFPPAAKGNKVYVGSTDQRLYALDAKTGELDWSYAAEERIESAPIIDKNLVYLCTSNGKLSAVNIDTHLLKWRFDSGGSVVTQPVFEGETLYLGSNDGKLYAIEGSSGKLLWAYDTTGLLVNPVAISDRYIYVVTNTKARTSLNISILAFQKGTYPGTDVVVYGHEESPFITALVDYFSATAKNTWTDRHAAFSLSDILPWPFGFQFSQAKQALIDLTRSAQQHQSYNILAKSFEYFSPGFSICALSFSFMLTPLSFVVLLAFLLLGWSLFLITISAFGLTKTIFLSTTLNEATGPKFLFLKICAQAISLTFRNYQLLVAGLITTSLGITASLALFNYLSPTPTVLTFYFAILLTWVILLFGGSFLRAFGLAVIQRDELSLLGLSGTIKHALNSILKIFVISLLYLASGLVICFLLELGQSYSFYIFTTLAILALTLIIVLPVFTDSYIVHEQISPSAALRKSSYLAVLNIRVVATYVLFMALVLGFCSLLASRMAQTTTGSILFMILVVLTSSYLTNVHSMLFKTLNNRNSG